MQSVHLGHTWASSARPIHGHTARSCGSGRAPWASAAHGRHQGDQCGGGLYDRITAEPGQFAIIELPHTDGPTGRPFWYQVSHGRPLPFNFEGQVAASLTRNPFVSELITDRAFHSQFAGIAYQDMSPEQMERGRQALVRQGFRFAMVSDRPGDDDLIVVQSVRRLLEEVVGAPVAEDRPAGLALYDLDRTTHDPGRRTE